MNELLTALILYCVQIDTPYDGLKVACINYMIECHTIDEKECIKLWEKSK